MTPTKPTATKEDPKTVTAVITYVRFNRGDFAIMTVHPKGAANTITIKGNIMPADLEKLQKTKAEVVFQGSWETHAKFGKQFKFSHYYEYHPEDASEISPGALAMFVAGELFGFGPINANRLIVDVGGTEALVGFLEKGDDHSIEAIQTSHDKLDRAKALTLVDAWGQKKAKMKVVSFFAELGISGIFPHRIFEEFGEGAIPTVKNNPYILIKHVDGIGFKRADEIAMKMGIATDSPVRLSAGILYTLEEKCWHAGNCYLERFDLVQACKRLTRIPSGIVDEVLTSLLAESYNSGDVDVTDKDDTWGGGGLLVDYDEGTGEQRIYIPSFYAAEVNVAEKIKEMIA